MGRYATRRFPQPFRKDISWALSTGDHTELGDTAIWAAIPVALLALVIWWRQREATSATEASAGGGSSVTTLTRRRTYLAPLSRTVTRIVVILAGD